MVGALLAAGVAGLATYLEIDQTFTFPKHAPRRVEIWLLTIGFAAANAVLAVGLYAVLSKATLFAGTATWVQGLLIGAGYLSLVRLKFATVNGQPFGFEYFFDLARNYAYKRIQRRVGEARLAAAKQYAENRSLADLIEEANVQTSFNEFDPDEQDEIKEWILRVAEDAEATSEAKMLMLADFILCGSRTTHK
jgi:hypothetical protein